MPFEILVAMLDQGSLGAVMMASGLAVAGLAAAFLVWRRSSPKEKVAPPPGQVAGEPSDVAEPVAEEDDTPAPAALPGRRRRSLVSDPNAVAETERESSLEQHADEFPIEADLEDEFDEDDLDEAFEDDPEYAYEDDNGGAFEENTLDDEPLDTDAAIGAIALSETDAREPEHAAPSEIELARWRPILFRQFRPQGPGKDGLSFFGGLPIGPSDFEWPRGRGKDGGPPLTFIMQWDCAQLAAQDATGLLPKDGVLYCFLNIDWGNHEEYSESHRFIHHSGPTDGWTEVAQPDDARPVFGKEGAWQMSYCTQAVDNADAFIPRTLTRFPFEPVAAEYPVPETDEGHGEHRFWNDEWAAEAVLAAQKSGESQAEDIGDVEQPPMPFARPFAAYPHDFGAIRILAASVLKTLGGSDPHYAERVYPDLTKEERDAQFAQWTEEAKELYQLGCQRPMGHAVEQTIADDIWDWAEARDKQLSLGFRRLVLDSVDLSLGIGSEAITAIPEELIDEAMRRHVLASEHLTQDGELEASRKVSTRNPARIFGSPSYVQGYVAEMIDDHLLLLELSSGSGPEHHFGEGVLQYMITPEDLSEGRFDRVKSVISGY